LSCAVAHGCGAFLDGLYLDACQLFDEWLLMQRERCRVQVLDALEKLTAYRLRGGECVLTTMTRFSTRAAIRERRPC
jgi:DNA-binding SARP family transcriptional activator